MNQPNLTPVKNPSPREQFRAAVDNISKHRNLIDSPEFGRAVQFSMLEYQAMLSTQTKDGNSAMAVGYKLQGALELMAVMRNLAETPPVTPRLGEKTLNHQA